MRSVFLLMIFCLFLLNGQAQQSGQRQYISAIVGFYNLENLFDTVDDPAIDDEEFLPGSAKRYNAAQYQKKLDQMAHVIQGIGTDVNPEGLALLGVVEIENETVLKDLAATEKLKSRNYQYVHFQSPDARGIDVGLLYNPKYFTVVSAYPHKVTLPDRYATRDILVVKGEFVGDTVFILVNHWPSRRGGSNAGDLSAKERAYNQNNTWRDRQNQIDLNSNSGLRVDGEEASRPNRMAAARECMTVVDSIQKAHAAAKVMIMGDFNDDPTSPSIEKVIQAQSDLAQVQAGQIYNPFANYLKQGYGTLAFNGKWNLFDQIMFSHPWLNQQQTSGWFLYKTHIYYRDFLVEPKGDYKGYPKRSWVGDRWNDGYSDHLPVYSVLVRAI
jgi:predicted extracellular nuclease